MNSRLKTVREARKRVERATKDSCVLDKSTNDSINTSFADHLSDITDEDAQTELNALKSIVIDDTSIDLVMAKLRLTRKYRSKLLMDKNLNLKEYFPFFFTHPHLVTDTILILMYEKPYHNNFVYRLKWNSLKNTVQLMLMP